MKAIVKQGGLGGRGPIDAESINFLHDFHGRLMYVVPAQIKQ